MKSLYVDRFIWRVYKYRIVIAWRAAEIVQITVLTAYHFSFKSRAFTFFKRYDVFICFNVRFILNYSIRQNYNKNIQWIITVTVTDSNHSNARFISCNHWSTAVIGYNICSLTVFRGPCPFCIINGFTVNQGYRNRSKFSLHYSNYVLLGSNVRNISNVFLLVYNYDYFLKKVCIRMRYQYFCNSVFKRFYITDIRIIWIV